MAYHAQRKLEDNIAAIRIALEHSADQPLSGEQVAALQRYSGFGGIKAILYPNEGIEQWQQGASVADQQLYPAVMELHQLLQRHLSEAAYKETVDALRNSSLTAFYTPVIIPQVLYAILQRQGVTPQRLYEPSSGAGVFITEAVKAFPGLKEITAIEKDQLTARVLETLSSSLPVPTTVHAMGLEHTSDTEKGRYDMVVSNIPFGNFPVFDPAYRNHELSGKIHNYFFAKGLDKLGDGGIMVYITTDGFLNSRSNAIAREYLFHRADFISLAVMPDNLMHDTGNTDAPSHLLIVQKKAGKTELSAAEQLLVQTTVRQNEFGQYYYNSYLQEHPELITGDETSEGKNQYGSAHQVIWQRGAIEDIAAKLSAILQRDVADKLDIAAYQQLQQQFYDQQQQKYFLVLNQKNQFDKKNYFR